MNDEKRKIYYQLSDGQNSIGTVDRIELSNNEFRSRDVGNLRAKIYEEKKRTLAGCGVGDLSIYAAGTTIDDYKNQKPLRIGLSLSDDQIQETSEDNPLLVVLAPLELLGKNETGLHDGKIESEKWYHVTGSILRPKTHAGARFKLFQFACSSNGLYPEGLCSESAFQTLLAAKGKDTDRTTLRFSVVFKTEGDTWTFTQSIGRYLLQNRGDLALQDYEGEKALKRPEVARISPYSTTMESRISELHFKAKDGEADPSSPIVDVVFQTRSSASSVDDTTILSSHDEVFKYQRIENTASFVLADAEAAHIFPSSKCTGPYKWLDDKPYNRLALSRDVHVNFDGTARGRGKRRKTARCNLCVAGI